ncbi:MAG: CheB methylesterase domain-containing protein [Acidimicrobiia bacterium]
MKQSVIVVGVSTGAAPALQKVFAALPTEFVTPICVVAQLPGAFIAALCERLDRDCALDVAMASGDDVLTPGAIRFAPAGHHLHVSADSFGLGYTTSLAAPRQGYRPCVDVLFESAAATCGARAIGVVLTGMGRDGCDGARAIRAAGGRVIAQDQDTSAVWGAPGAVVRASLANHVAPIEAIASKLCEWTMAPANA